MRFSKPDHNFSRFLLCNWWKTGIALLVCPLFPCWVMSQTGILGTANISLIDQSESCGGMGRLIQVYADVSGLVGAEGDPVGLNGFVVTINLDRPWVFASAIAGHNPNLTWGFEYTHRDMVQVTGSLVLVGWVADTEAPNLNYHLASLILAGEIGPTSLTVVSTELASRVVNGQMPEGMNVNLPATLSIFLSGDFSLRITDGLVFWGDLGGNYDIEDPAGVNVQDFVTIVNCGGAL